MDQTGLPSRHDLALRLSPPRCRVSSPPLSPHSGSPTGWQDQQDPAAGSFRVEMSQTQSWFPFKSKPLTLYDYPYTLSVLLEMIHALVIKEVSGVWCEERKVTAFWSVSDFSYPNHVHATDVARLFLFLFWVTPSVSRSLSSMFVCSWKRPSRSYIRDTWCASQGNTTKSMINMKDRHCMCSYHTTHGLYMR